MVPDDTVAPSVEAPWLRRGSAEIGADHTSDAHAWFDRSRRADPGSAAYRFYDWRPGAHPPPTVSEGQAKWAWDKDAQAWYRCGCCRHQPRLDLEDDTVRAAVAGCLRRWLDMGADGLWLHRAEPACPGATPPGAHDGLLLGRGANTEQALRRFVRHDGDHGLLNQDILEAIRAGHHRALAGSLDTGGSRLAVDLMPWSAGRRVAFVLGNDRRALDLYYMLLFSLPGMPFLAYGDEIGMEDEWRLGPLESQRIAMQWSAAHNAGFSKAPVIQRPLCAAPGRSQRALNVEEQLLSPDSLLSSIGRALAIRAQLPPLGRGSCQLLQTGKDELLAFVRRHGSRRVLVVANLSREVRWDDIDLSGLPRMSMVEAFGGVRFPPASGSAYRVTLGPRAVYWLIGTPSAVRARVSA